MKRFFLIVVGYLLVLASWLPLLRSKHFRQPTIEEHLAEQRGRLPTTHEEGTPPAGPLLTLGKVEASEYFPVHIGVYTHRMLAITEDILDTHLVVIGEIGSGKTTGLLTLIDQLVRNTNRDIIVVNGKGDEEFAQSVRALLYPRRGETPIVRLGSYKRGAHYDAFRGDALAIYNRLVKLAGLEEMRGEATFWAELHRNGLQLICFAPDGPPRSFAEVEARLDQKWLNNTYKNNAARKRIVADVVKDRGTSGSALRNLALLLSPIINELGGVITQSGYGLEDGNVIFSVRTESIPDTARRFFALFVEDAKDYIGNRQKKPAALIIDEFHAFNNESITWLLSMARSFKLAVILATQSTASLGKDLQQKLLLSNTTTVISLRTMFPEDICNLAGTIEAPLHTHQVDSGSFTSMGSVRIEDKYRIDPNDVARLPNGYAYLVRQRTYAKFRFYRQTIDLSSLPPELTYTPPPPPSDEPPPDVMELK